MIAVRFHSATRSRRFTEAKLFFARRKYGETVARTFGRTPPVPAQSEDRFRFRRFKASARAGGNFVSVTLFGELL